MKTENPDPQQTIPAKFHDLAAMQAVLKQAAHDAVQEHARAGRKIPIWRDNQVVWILPEIKAIPSFNPEPAATAGGLGHLPESNAPSNDIS